MAITYSLGPNPKWYIADLTGRPLAGGYMATYSSLNHTQFKAVYVDPAGQFPWPYVTIPNVGSQGILFDENGAQGPFYWKFDSSTPSGLYYIEVYDSDGVLQWTVDNYTGDSGSGGGTITEALDLQNLIANNVMYRNTGTVPASPGVFLKLAPGANAGLVQTASNAGPDICFIKNNASATDTVSFPKFTLGSGDLTGDVTPVDYLRYSCTGAGSGETSKYVQFPICQGAQNLSNQDVTVTIWARCTSGNTSLTLYWLQFYGDGAGASASSRTPIQTLTLTSSWQKFSVQDTVPDATGKTLGGCGNDGIFVQAQYPLDATTVIDLTKPCLFLGSIAPDQEFQTYDAIDGNVDTARTGDIRTSITQLTLPGWVPMNNGTIGNASSNATTRAAPDTFPLFDLLWNIGSTLTPMYTSANAAQARGATSIADYTANHHIALTKSLGQLMTGTTNSNIASQAFTTSIASATDITVTNASQFGTGTPVLISGSPPPGLNSGAVYFSIFVSATAMRLATTLPNAMAGTAISFTAAAGSGTVQSYAVPLGTADGESTHTLTTGELATHTHALGSNAGVAINGQQVYANTIGSGSFTIVTPSMLSVNANTPWELTGITNETGSSTPFSIVQPETFLNMFMKL